MGSVKLCDFGIAGKLVDSIARTQDVGCKPYMAVSFFIVYLPNSMKLDSLKDVIFCTTQ